jgi:hypothetical protein
MFQFYETADHLQVLNPLLFLVQCHQRIWMSADELEPKWLERDYTEYLGDSCNILARANTFSVRQRSGF